MNEPQAHDPSAEGKDWRLSFGLLVSFVWLSLGFLYISRQVGWFAFTKQPAPDLGSFLEGAFAPLAFLWLVVGFFLQQKQLTQNTLAVERQYLALRRSAEQAEIQARAISANELHARQDTFMEVARMVSNQLGVISGYLWMSSQSPSQVNESIAQLWTQLGSGDHATFSRSLIALIFSGGENEASELLWSTPIRTRHSENFVRVFERLQAAARECDPSGMIAEALAADAHGRLYQFICDSRPT